MYQRFVEFIEKNQLLEKNEKLVVGVSGGADSVCLLSLLCRYRKELSFDMTVVHINHNIRKEAKEDALFVEKLCQKYGVPFVSESVCVNDVAKQWHMSTEEAGRKIRYEAFHRALGKEGGKIAVAHNLNDVAETVLFNLFRGSKSTGLTGIRPKNENIIRPLLCFQREEIERYLQENHLEFCIDKTNLTDDYTRNKIRNHILPYAEKEIVKGSISHIYNTADFLSKQEDYLKLKEDEEYEKAVRYSENKEQYFFEKNCFEKLHPYIQKRLVYRAISELAGSRKDISDKHVEEVMALFEKEGMKHLDLPYNLQVKSAYEQIVIEKKKPEDSKTKDAGLLEAQKGFTFRIFSAKMPVTIPEKTYTKWFDYDKIVEVPVVRTRKEGDYLMMQGGSHKKSLGRYFIDEKIPKDERDKVLLVADGSHVMWVVGKRISEYYKITKNTKKILEIQYDGGF